MGKLLLSLTKKIPIKSLKTAYAEIKFNLPAVLNEVEYTYNSAINNGDIEKSYTINQYVVFICGCLVILHYDKCFDNDNFNQTYFWNLFKERYNNLK